MKSANYITSFLKQPKPSDPIDKRNPGWQTRAYTALFLSIIAISFAPIMLRAAQAPGPISTFYRMLTAIVIMAVPFYREVKAKASVTRGSVALAILGGLFFSLDLVFWSTGVMLGGAGLPTLLSNTAPIWVGLGAMVLFRERLSMRFWAGVLLAMSGSAIILGFNPFGMKQIETGSLMGLISGIFYAAYFLVTQHGRKAMPSLTYFWIAACSTAAGLFIFSILLNLPFGGYSLTTCLLFLAMGIVGQVGGFLSISYALGYLPASIVSPTLLLQPVMTMIIAGLLLGEYYSILQIAGGCAVLAGVFFVQSGQ